MTLPFGDLERSVAFYRAALVIGMDWVERTIDGSPTFGPEGAEDVSLVAGGPLAPPIDLAFARRATSRSRAFTVKAWPPADVTTGLLVRAPSTRRGYYGAFLLDPDGHNVEAVWHAPDEG